MSERTTDSLTSTGEINWEARSGFHERIKQRMEQKVKDQAKLISELKDDLIEALKTKPIQSPASAKICMENVELRKKLAAGLTSYQAEVKRADDLLVERGDYAAEVLTLKADLAAMQTDAYHPLTIKVNHLEAVVRNLKAENADFQLVIEGQRKTINGQNETIRKWNEQILEDGEIIKKQKAELAHATHLYQEELRTEKIGREKMASKSRRIIELEDNNVTLLNRVKAWLSKYNTEVAQNKGLGEALCEERKAMLDKIDLIEIQKGELKAMRRKLDNNVLNFKHASLEIAHLRLERNGIQAKLEAFRQKTVKSIGTEKLERLKTRVRNILQDSIEEVENWLD